MASWRRGNWQNIHYTMGDWMDELAFFQKQMERGWLKSCENSLWRISTSFNPISYVKCNLLLFGNILTCPRSPRSLSLPNSSSLGRDAGTQMRVFSPSRISKSAPRQLLMTCEMSRDFFKHFCHKSVGDPPRHDLCVLISSSLSFLSASDISYSSAPWPRSKELSNISPSATWGF